IDEVIQSVDGDKINFIVRISNNGTVLAHRPEVKIRFDESFEISEVVEHTFYAGTTLAYPLSFSLHNLPTRDVSMMCFEIDAAANTFTDVTPLNNRECVNLGSEFIVVNPYPNPAKGTLNIPVILPGKQKVEVLLYNNEGALVYQAGVSDTKSGLNMLSMDIGNIAGGNYVLSLKYSGQTQFKKLVVRR